MRHTFPLALGAALIASALTTVAAQTTKPNTSATAQTRTTMNPDHQFVMEAARGGMAEVELGKLASQKATNPKVKSFGEQMVTEHGKAGDELKSLADSKNIKPPTELSVKHKALKDRLAKLSGGAFDRAYITEMVKDHQLDAAEFHKEANSGQDPDVKAWAAKTVVTVDDHLKMARDIQKELTATPTP
jgi:putative membrane protein